MVLEKLIDFLFQRHILVKGCGKAVAAAAAAAANEGGKKEEDFNNPAMDKSRIKSEQVDSNPTVHSNGVSGAAANH